MNNKKTSSRRVGMRDISAGQVLPDEKACRSGVNLTMSYKGHLDQCWVDTQPTKRDTPARGEENHVRAFTLNRHAESSLLSISTAEKTQGRDPEQKPFGMALCKGFTLIELLVIVLIIGVLAAIAVPQYQKAVLKSRFSSLMPTTQAIRDGQEAYYLNNSRYADEIAKLDVKATNTDDMSIDVGDEEETPELSYVIASRPNINNNLIMYQKHSEKFADNVHCEALKDNAQAQWLCKDALHGQPIDGSIHEDYDTYVLSGTLRDNDYFSKECEGSGEQACECGAPIMGTCDDKTGEWNYEGECPTPTLQSPVPCGSGYTGNKVHKAKCNSAGTAYEYYWDESACVQQVNATYLKGYENAMAAAQALAANLEAYYDQHGTYPAKYWYDWSGKNDLCYANVEEGQKNAYCTFSYNGVYVGGALIVLNHASDHQGMNACYAKNSEFSKICEYVAGSGGVNKRIFY